MGGLSETKFQDAVYHVYGKINNKAFLNLDYLTSALMASGHGCASFISNNLR